MFDIRDRPHRLLAVFCALQAWQRGLQAIWLDRSMLCEYLLLEKIKEDRISWLVRDFKPWFPYHEHFCENSYGEWINEITFSRVPFSSIPPIGKREGIVGKLQAPEAGLNERHLTAALMNMTLGFDEPLKVYGFNQLERPDPHLWMKSLFEKAEQSTQKQEDDAANEGKP